jgi:hypothetical protein
LGVAAVLDPAFEPSTNNAGSKHFPFITDFIEQEMKKLDMEEDDSPLLRSRTAEAIIKHIAETLGGERVVVYLDDFFMRYRPTIDRDVTPLRARSESESESDERHSEA